MNSRIEKIKKFSEFLLNHISELSTDELNRIPEGYNNNIIWNAAHMISAQQGLCYLRSANAVIVSDEYFSPYLNNTKPEKYVEAGEISIIKQLLITTIDQMESDLEKKIFDNYTASPNVLKIYGIELTTIDDALEFLFYHDGFHSGCIAALKRTVSKDRIK
jgi:hypothetical protein